MTPLEEPVDRRPLTSRGWKPMQRIANALIRWRLSPNAISCSSMVFAAGAGAAFYGTTIVPDGARWLWLVAAVCVQLRLLANLFDGMVSLSTLFRPPMFALIRPLPNGRFWGSRLGDSDMPSVHRSSPVERPMTVGEDATDRPPYLKLPWGSASQIELLHRQAGRLA